MSEPLHRDDQAATLLAGYRPLPGRHDELLGADGKLRPQWRALVSAFSDMSPELRHRAATAAAGQLRANDIAYISSDTHHPRPWRLDVFPFLITPEDWTQLARGLVQRARLLNAIVGDLYGPQQTLARGLIPAPMVFASPEFMPNCAGYRARDGEFLQFLAFDLGRGPDGRWFVLSQRTESPAGVGYALENRLVTSRSIPEPFTAHNLHRLAGFFRRFADHFAEIGDQHRSVVLTGGADQPDYFEHALMGRYLGYPVVESADLTVRESRVFMKTLEGLERVDLVIRRIPSEHVDPLELRAPQGMGIAGLLHAARSGNVVLANAIGSGVVESPALETRLPQLAQALLGESLSLPGLTTWWCGDADARAHVLAQSERLTRLHAFRPRHLMTAGASEFMTSDPELTDPEVLRRALALHPQNYVGVEPLQLSTVPCLTANGTLRPAPMVMRVYVAATSDGYQVMHGGLVKVSGTDISGGERTSKDVWVLSNVRVEPETLLKPLRAATLKRSDRDLASKTADDLFWLGRYLERADASTRLLRSLFLHLSGEASFGNVPVALPILTGLMNSFGHLSEQQTARMRAAGFRGVENEISNLLFEPGNADSLAGILGNVARTADQVRERLSVDALRLIERLTNIQRLRFPAHGISETVALLNELTDLQSALSGLIHENMTRGYGWRFLDMGRRIERARYGITVMKTLLIGRERGAAGVLGMQLELADSLITYRSRYKTEPELAAALDLILADDSNPRSLIFQFAAMRDHMAVMPLETHDGHLSRAQRNLVGMHTELLLADVDELASSASRGGNLGQLRRLLERAEDSIGKLTDLITQTYFSHSIGHRVTGNVIRSQDDAL